MASSSLPRKQAPLAMVLVMLVKAWYARCALREPALLPKPLPCLAPTQGPTVRMELVDISTE